MRQTSIREVDYLIAWFVFFVGATITGAILGSTVGGWLIPILIRAFPNSNIFALTGIVSFVLGIPASYGAFRLAVGLMIVRKLV